MRSFAKINPRENFRNYKTNYALHVADFTVSDKIDFINKVYVIEVVNSTFRYLNK